MDIRHLRYFVSVAETLSFVKAARELNMSQPPLSKRIADLEDEIGTKLFERTSKQVELTEAGRKFLPYAWETVRTFDAARRVARDLAPAQTKIVRIALPPETSRELISGMIGLIGDDRIDVQLLEASTAEQQLLLNSNEIDIGVLRYPFNETGLHVSAPLAQELRVVTDARHPLAKHDKIKLADLNPFPLVMFPRRLSPGLYDELLTILGDRGYHPSRILHVTLMARAMLKTEMAIAISAERAGNRNRSTPPKEFAWRAIEGPPVHWWTSVVCKAEAYVGPTKSAFDKLFLALKQHENWAEKPRLVRNDTAFQQGDRDISQDFIRV